MKICVFDSGVGGLICLEKLKKLVENVKLDSVFDVELVYVNDASNMPYGNKTKTECLKCVLNALGISFSYNDLDYALIGSSNIKQDSNGGIECGINVKQHFDEGRIKCDFDVLILACNSATALCASGLRAILDCKVFGIEPAVKLAKKEIKNLSDITIICTPATSKMRRNSVLWSGLHILECPTLASEIESLVSTEQIGASEIESLVSVGEIEANEIVNLANAGQNEIGRESKRLVYMDSHEVCRELERLACRISSACMKNIVIGCTHYSYLNEYLERLGHRVFDGVDGLVRNVWNYLSANYVM